MESPKAAHNQMETLSSLLQPNMGHAEALDYSSSLCSVVDRDPKFHPRITMRLTGAWKSANIAVVPSENFLSNALDVGPGEDAGLVIRKKKIEV